jgi:branched-chain amino acid aminotransferase
MPTALPSVAADKSAAWDTRSRSRALTPDMPTLRRTANVDGAITPLEDARIPVLDRGFLYGDSVYEVFRTYDGIPLFYEEHLERLENSAARVHMRITQSRDELTAAIRRTIEAAGAERGQEVYVRYHITRGAGPVDLLPNPAAKTSYVIMVKEVPTWKTEFYSEGVRLAVPPTLRNPSESLDPNIKGGNYMNNVLALSEAVAAGADDCLMLNRAGLVTEASNSNVFFELDGLLVTPSQKAGNLRGITKAAIHRACTEKRIVCEEQPIHANDLPRATECFITSATREVMPVRSLRLADGRLIEFLPGGGQLTRQIAQLYKDYVQQYLKSHEHLRMV